MSIRYYLVLSALLLSSFNSLHAQQLPERFRHIVDTTFAAHPSATGVIVTTVGSDGEVRSYAVGISDKATQAPLTADQPVLIASNVKTYISAAIFRLCEQKKMDLGASIETYLPASTTAKLSADGYDVKKITVTHLLSHTSGIAEYVDDEYFEFVNTHKRYRWTRDEQIDRAMKIGKPLAAAGDTFKYADVNYLLLTEMIEQLTHRPFYKAVSDLDKYQELKLRNTWFTTLDPTPSGAKTMAHQYWNKYPWDSYDLDPSWDLYGGGGIAATPADLARFFKYLFEGKIIKDTALLAKMYADVPCKTKTNYCLGIRKLKLADMTAYYHGGFWGTDAIYFPEIKTAMSIVILERSQRDLSASICKAIAEDIKNQQR